MVIVIKAHFDGKTIVPEEPVDLPVNQSMEVGSIFRDKGLVLKR